MPYAQVLGGLFQLGGAFVGSNQANRRNNKLNAIANTPGLDTTKTATEAINGIFQNLPGAEGIASQTNQFNQDQLDSILESIVPGYKAGQSQRAKNSEALLRGELPADVASRVERKAAERSAAGGYGGSRAAANLTLRDLGLTSLDAMQAGDRMFQGQVSGTPRANLVNPLDWVGLNPTQLVGLREQERMDKMDRLTGVAKAPTSRDVWSKALTDIGGEVQGMGAGGMFKGKS